MIDFATVSLLVAVFISCVVITSGEDVSFFSVVRVNSSDVETVLEEVVGRIVEKESVVVFVGMWVVTLGTIMVIHVYTCTIEILVHPIFQIFCYLFHRTTGM